jgi:putative Ca2+/H+ antiporter (TMEM165/GDT1 family)
MGDKTQLLAIVLAATFRRPWPVIAGIPVATFFNHAAAGAVGVWAARAMGPVVVHWLIGLSFLGPVGIHAERTMAVTILSLAR